MKLQTVLDRITALEQAKQPEKIPFTDHVGVFNIDFTVNNRQAKYLPQKTLAFRVVDGEDVLIDGFSLTIAPTTGITTSIALDGIAGTGYVLLTD